MNTQLTKELFLCECNSVQHQLIVLGWPQDPDWPEIYVTLHLAQVPWYRRVQYAFRYVLGLEQKRLGAFEEIMLSPERARELVAAINKHLEPKNDHAPGNRVD